MANKTEHRQTIDRIQDRLLASTHGEFYVTSDFCHLGDAPGRKPARRALVEIQKMGGVLEIHPGHWMVKLTDAALEELTPAKIDRALMNAANSMSVYIQQERMSDSVNPPPASDQARMAELTHVIRDLQGEHESRGGWERVYVDHTTRTITPDEGLMVPKLSGLVTWKDGSPVGNTPVAQHMIDELKEICNGQ